LETTNELISIIGLSVIINTMFRIEEKKATISGNKKELYEFKTDVQITITWFISNDGINNLIIFITEVI
jgi:hypothetical protein